LKVYHGKTLWGFPAGAFIDQSQWQEIPMPNRKEGEKLSDFIGRFVSSRREERKFPKLKQRLAVGYAEAKEQAKKERRHGA
jgi:hypothetical protein